MQSIAATVKEYLAELPEDRRAAIQAVREVILKNLDKDYEEGMQYGMIGYYVPHRLYPAGYHCDPRKPLPFAALSSQKNHMGLGIMCHYADTSEDKWFRAAWAKTGKKLDMGKCCVRFKKLEDVPLEVVGEAIRRIPAKQYIDIYESLLLPMNKQAAAKAARKKAETKSKGSVTSPKKSTSRSAKPTVSAKKIKAASSSARKSQRA